MDYVDLHIHSKYSDGTLTPEEIVRSARARGVGLISVCDHNEIRGTLQVMSLSEEAKLRCIPGVEIDALFGGQDIHILCYGADLTNRWLLTCITHARDRLDNMSRQLLLNMVGDYPQLNMEEYEAFSHNFRLGGWKMLQYLCHKGITVRLRDGLPLYERYGVLYAEAGFDSAQHVVEAIHQAGGRAVLAHPGVIYPTDRISQFVQHVEKVMDQGLDGIECYYPRHSPGITRALLEICQQRNAMVTAGSDCHGAFNHSEIGQTRTPLSALALDNLL